MSAKKYYIDINEKYCKGCGICVGFCPVKVLELRYQQLKVKDQDLCIGCKNCELRCPDFAIHVEVKG